MHEYFLSITLHTNNHVTTIFEGLKDSFFLFPQVNGTEIEYEFEEITLERVSVSRPSQITSDNP